MKLGMFTEKESYIAWLEREIEAIRNNGLKQAKKEYEAALRGEGKEWWMRFNNATSEDVWERHLLWLRNRVEHLEGKIEKYQREIAKNI